MPNGPHVANGTVEQTSSNPWTVDICDFDEVNGYYTYTPGRTYNSKTVKKKIISMHVYHV